eukprot:jgi/Mesen1/9272/ME000060S08705
MSLSMRTIMWGRGAPLWRKQLCLAFATLSVSFLLLLPGIEAEALYTGTDVIELTPSSFKSKVLEDNNIWMVEFYAPWCGHCQRLKPDYIKAATSTKGIVRFGAVNCDDHQSVASQYGVKGFPTLKIFASNKKKPEDYMGGRTSKAMSDALISKLPNMVTPVTSKNHNTFIEGQKEMPRVLLFTAKSTTAALYKSLALQLKARMALGEVRAKRESSLLTAYNVSDSQLPRLVVIPVGEGAGGEHQVYEGELKYKGLAQFLKKYALPKPNKEDKGGAKANKTRQADVPKVQPEPRENKKLLHHITNQQELAPLCGQTARFCVLAFLPSMDHLELPQVAETAARYSKDPFTFAWLEHPKFRALSELLAVSDAPSVTIINCKRRKFVTVEGISADLPAYLDRAIGGDLLFPSSLPTDWLQVMDT